MNDASATNAERVILRIDYEIDDGEGCAVRARSLAAAILVLPLLVVAGCSPASTTPEPQLSSPTSSHATTPQEPDEYPGSATPTSEADAQLAPPQRIDYAVPNGSDPSQNHGELWLPAVMPERLPVVVLLHGGGWRVGATLHSLDGMARSLVRAGVAVWNLEYRKIGAGGGFPQTLQDAASGIDALATIRAQHPQIDLNDVVLLGHSAGGQMAAWAAGRSLLTPGAFGSVPLVVPRAVVSLAGVLDMKMAAADRSKHTIQFLGGLPAEVPGNYQLADPMAHLNPAVPLTCFNGTADTVVRAHECTSYIAALKAAGGSGDAIIVNGLTHNRYSPPHPIWAQVQATVLSYLKSSW